MDAESRDLLSTLKKDAGARTASPKLFEDMCVEMWRAIRFQRPMAIAIFLADAPPSSRSAVAETQRSMMFRATSTWLEKNLRLTDQFGRLNKNELLIILPETDLAGARRVGERVLECAPTRQMIEKSAQHMSDVRYGCASLQRSDDAASFLERTRVDVAAASPFLEVT